MNHHKHKKILLIDDSNTIRRTGELFLKQAGYEVIQAGNGIDGLAQALLNIPDIIFLDVMMPSISGLSVCATLKTHYALKHIPVVMLSSKDSKIDREKGFLSGANLYLEKPFSKTSLLEAIQLLNIKENRNE